MRREPVLEAGAALPLPVDQHLVRVPREENGKQGVEADLVYEAARALDDDHARARACGLWGCFMPVREWVVLVLVVYFA